MTLFLALPILFPFAPAWLVYWTVGRIIPALSPLAAAAIASGAIHESREDLRAMVRRNDLLNGAPGPEGSYYGGLSPERL